MPILQKGQNGHGLHETGRHSSKLRNYFPKTAKLFPQNCEIISPKLRNGSPKLRNGSPKCVPPHALAVPAMPYGQPSATRSASAATIAPLMPHGLERLRHGARALVRKLSHRRLGHGPRDHEPHPAPTRLRLLRQNRERRPRSKVIDSGPAWCRSLARQGAAVPRTRLSFLFRKLSGGHRPCGARLVFSNQSA